MTKFLTLSQLGGRFTNAEEYNENLHYFITELSVGLEYISDEMNKLYECRSKVLDMDLSHTKENKLLEKIYVAMVRQYKADIKFSETLSKTNELLDEYGIC